MTIKQTTKRIGAGLGALAMLVTGGCATAKRIAFYPLLNVDPVAAGIAQRTMANGVHFENTATGTTTWYGTAAPFNSIYVDRLPRGPSQNDTSVLYNEQNKTAAADFGLDGRVDRFNSVDSDLTSEIISGIGIIIGNEDGTAYKDHTGKDIKSKTDVKMNRKFQEHYQRNWLGRIY